MSVGETVTHDHKTYPPECARPGRSNVRTGGALECFDAGLLADLAAPGTGALRSRHSRRWQCPAASNPTAGIRASCFRISDFVRYFSFVLELTFHSHVVKQELLRISGIGSEM